MNAVNARWMPLGVAALLACLVQGCAMTLDKSDVFSSRDQLAAVATVPLDASLDRARVSEIAVQAQGRVFRGYRYAAPAAKRAVLFFPGNATATSLALSRLASLFNEGGTDVYVLSYGQPDETEPSVAQVDAMAHELARLAAASSGLSSEQLIAIGHSLGGWVALHLAGTSSVRCAVVAGTGTTAAEAAARLAPGIVSWALRFKASPDVALLDNVEQAKRSRVPTLVLGSKADTVMPAANSQAIFNALATGSSSELEIAGAVTHGAYFRDPELVHKIKSFLSRRCVG